MARIRCLLLSATGLAAIPTSLALLPPPFLPHTGPHSVRNSVRVRQERGACVLGVFLFFWSHDAARTSTSNIATHLQLQAQRSRRRLGIHPNSSFHVLRRPNCSALSVPRVASGVVTGIPRGSNRLRKQPSSTLRCSCSYHCKRSYPVRSVFLARTARVYGRATYE